RRTFEPAGPATHDDDLREILRRAADRPGSVEHRNVVSQATHSHFGKSVHGQALFRTTSIVQRCTRCWQRPPGRTQLGSPLLLPASTPAFCPGTDSWTLRNMAA